MKLLKNDVIPMHLVRKNTQISCLHPKRELSLLKMEKTLLKNDKEITVYTTTLIGD